MADVSFSCWINAWSIDLGLRKLKGRQLSVTQSGGLVSCIVTEPLPGDTVFFTDEASMRSYVGNKSYITQPENLPGEVFDDKLAFAKFVQSLSIPTIPFQTISENFREATFPVLVKARHSWKNGKHVYRGWVCRSVEELMGTFIKIAEQGYEKEEYFLQSWLDKVSPEDNFSVSGYWDAKNNDRNLLAVVQRTSSYNSGQSCSSSVAVVPDPSDLIGRSGKVLNGLQYTGPFEIEFLRTENGFLILEFNPRFWYQNGIFIPHGNGLIKRYLGIEGTVPRGGVVIDKGTWLDSIWLLRSIAKLQFSVISEVLRASRLGRAKIDLFPTIPVAIKYFTKRLFTRKPSPGTP